jgi:hypothetical protein
MPARRLTYKKSPPSRHLGKRADYKLSVLFIEEASGWAAQVLEHDIATQADTLHELFYEVERLLVSHVALADAEGRPPFEGIPPAPQKYWRMFKNSHISMKRPAAGLRAGKFPPPTIEKDIRIAESVAA